MTVPEQTIVLVIVLGKNDSTSNRSLNNDSTSISRSEQMIDSTYDKLSDHKIVCGFIDSRKNNTSFDYKCIPETNSLLDKSRILCDKLYERTISQYEKSKVLLTLTNWRI